VESIKNSIQEYLGRQTDYALLIRGGWGIGKTFFFKNEINPIIKKTPTSFDDRINYELVNVSLYCKLPLIRTVSLSNLHLKYHSSQQQEYSCCCEVLNKL